MRASPSQPFSSFKLQEKHTPKKALKPEQKPKPWKYQGLKEALSKTLCVVPPLNNNDPNILWLKPPLLPRTKQSKFFSPRNTAISLSLSLWLIVIYISKRKTQCNISSNSQIYCSQTFDQITINKPYQTLLCERV